MSVPKRRSRKSKLVPRCTEGGDPEIQEMIKTEHEEEPQIKIMNTMSLATTSDPQPGPSKAGSGSIQFKVDIEVEEWIDDEMFIEENFNKMQTEKLSEALDREITEEADWTNEEYGKIWAEAASDSETEEKPLNEYEKIIKNQVDPSILTEPPKVKEESKPSEANPRDAEKTNVAKIEEVTKKKVIPKKTTELPSKPKEKVFPKPMRQYQKKPGPKSRTEQEAEIKINIVCSLQSESSNLYQIDMSEASGETQTEKLPPTILNPESDLRKTVTSLGKIKTCDSGDLQVYIIPPEWKEWYARNCESLASDDKDESKTVPKPLNTGELAQIVVDDDEIIMVSEQTVKSADVTDKVDVECRRILDIHLRNKIGQTRFTKIPFAKEDTLIHDALQEWTTWNAANKMNASVKSIPQTYTCCMCSVGWWHLDPFRTHLKKHRSELYRVAFIQKSQECHIVALKGYSTPKEVPIDGECWKCGKTQNGHIGFEEEVYKCRGCNSSLYTCVALAEHEGICLSLWKEQMEVQKTEDVRAFKCKICPQIFFSKKLLQNHQSVSHVPRSDRPVPQRVQRCRRCLRWFPPALKSHHCKEKVHKFRCELCYRQFPSGRACSSHLIAMRSVVTCQICSKFVRGECSMADHVLEHSEHYRRVYKCLACSVCTVLLEDGAMAAKHAEFVHHFSKPARDMWCFVPMLIPTSLYHSKRVVTVHTPFPHHQKLREAFLKDLAKPIAKCKVETKLGNKSPAADSMVEMENNMDKYLEEQTSHSDSQPDTTPMIVDSSSIKLEITDDVEGTEVSPAELMEATQDEVDTVVVKQEVERDETGPTEEEDFSEKLHTFLENMEEKEQVKDDSFPCSSCEFVGDRKQYNKHLKICPAAVNKVRKCNKCDKLFKTMKDYVKHLPRHGFPRSHCVECSKEFPTLAGWVFHMESHIRRSFSLVKLLSTDTKVHRCRSCKEMVQPSSFFEHWQTHLETPKRKSLPVLAGQKSAEITPEILQRINGYFQTSSTDRIPKHCIVCGRIFRRMYEKKRHLVEHLLVAAAAAIRSHGGLRCQICGYNAAKPDQFRRHMRDHAGITMYHCELCDKTFSDSSNFVKHKKVHSTEVYFCRVCNKKFVAEASLKAHVATHRAEPLRCLRCPDKLFHSDSAYRKHVRSAHDKSSGTRCHYCRERFLTVKAKWDHQWEAHRVRKQVADCMVCGQQFRKMSDVRNHIISEHARTNK